MKAQQLQFISITPEELQQAIMDGVRSELEGLKKDFEPKKPIEWVPRHEAAKMLDIKLNTLWKWTKDGVLTAYGIKSRVYYKRSELEQALQKLDY